MESDDELDDEGSSGALLPAADRLWRHPSELALAGWAHCSSGDGLRVPGASMSGTAPRAADNRLLTVALLAGAIGALLASGVSYVVGGGRSRTIAVAAVERDVVSPVATLASTGQASGFVTGARVVRASCVVLVARDAHGTRTSTGVVVRSDGMLIATAHSVVGAQSIAATVRGSQRVSARLVASDPTTDLAVVKLDGGGYDPAPLGSALDLQVGDPVMTMRPPTTPGAPDGVPGDQGSVASLGRSITGSGGRHLSDLLEVDTTQAPSTVGAPLLDSHGAVVAITTGLGDDGRPVEFATPVDLAHQVEEQLLRSGHVVAVWLGVDGQELPAGRARSLGVAGGALVSRVYPDSPAASGGLRSADVVLGVDGRRVTSMSNLIMALHARPPGTQVSLDVQRDGAALTLTAQLAPRPPGIG